MRKFSMKNIAAVAALQLALMAGFTSCSDDDKAPSYSTAAVSNSELMTILKAKGYQFNEQGNLLLDDKATSTTSLDLSGTKISQKALAELNILPNLTDVNLSNNGYGPVFHVDSLPAQIKGLDLQGNEIYDFEGLVDAKVVNDEVVATVLHPFNKLYLPASCKYNVEDLMPFYTASNTESRATANSVDMKMVNDKGTLETYNTLREIPDEYFRKYLKSKFSSIFTADNKLDISKPLALAERGGNILLQYDTDYENIFDIQSLEGLEYFINNPYLQSYYIFISIKKELPFSLAGRLMPNTNVTGLVLENVNTISGIDCSKATNLSAIGFSNNPSLVSLNLTKTAFLNQDIKDFNASAMMFNSLSCKDCENLEEISISKSSYNITQKVVLANLPKLKSIDLKKIEGISTLALCQIPLCDISYPTSLKYVYYGSENIIEEISEDNQIDFAISQEVKDMESTKNFLDKYYDFLNNDKRSFRTYKAVNF